MKDERQWRPHSPFEDGAADWLYRMGLLTAEGAPEEDAVAAAGRMFSGLLYGSLCDFYQEEQEVSAAVGRLLSAARSATPKQQFLAICLQYDGIYCPLPDPVWWISGSPKLAELFADAFLSHIKLLDEAEERG